MTKKKPAPAQQDWTIPDIIWHEIEPLIPPEPTHPLGIKRPRLKARNIMNAIFYKLRTGMQWKALKHTQFDCSGSTAHRRFQEWVEAGVFLEIWRQGLLKYDELQGLDWEWLSMDGAITKAPLAGEKNWSKPYRPRQARGQTQPTD